MASSIFDATYGGGEVAEVRGGAVDALDEGDDAGGGGNGLIGTSGGGGDTSTKSVGETMLAWKRQEVSMIGSSGGSEM